MTLMNGSEETNPTTGVSVTSTNAKRPGNPNQKERIKNFWKELLEDDHSSNLQ